MASNSDSIFNLLSYLKRHPKDRYIVKSHCTNVVQIFVKDTVKVSDADIYFPDHKLMVNRLEDSFLEQHGSLLDYYWNQLGKKSIGFHEIWATTSHLKQRAAYFVELSYE